MYELMPFGRKFHEINAFDPFHEMDNFFFGNKNNSALSPFSTDIIDNGDSLELHAELPGFNKEDINLELNDDILTINANHAEQKDDNKPNYVRRERFYGSYSRSFDITGINTEAIEATYKDGILSLILPKTKEEDKPKKIISIQ